MEKLQWFKFTPSDWMMGKIQKTPEITQARFMRLCCLYWNKECELTYEDAEIEVDQEHLDTLIRKKIIKCEDDMIYIDFLDEQMGNIHEISEKRRKAANKRWKGKNANASKHDASAVQTDAEESREEENENREEGEKKFNFKKSLIEYGFKKELVDDWMEVRRKTRAVNSKTALLGFLREVEKTGMDMDQVLQICVERSWRGLQAKWITDNTNTNGSTGHTKEQSARNERQQRLVERLQGEIDSDQQK